jgi:hypothetical protein
MTRRPGRVNQVTKSTSAVAGASKNTIIFSKPLEFNKSNYLKHDF